MVGDTRRLKPKYYLISSETDPRVDPTQDPTVDPTLDLTLDPVLDSTVVVSTVGLISDLTIDVRADRTGHGSENGWPHSYSQQVRGGGRSHRKLIV